MVAYHCEIHPDMQASLVVGEADGGGATTTDVPSSTPDNARGPGRRLLDIEPSVSGNVEEPDRHRPELLYGAPALSCPTASPSQAETALNKRRHAQRPSIRHGQMAFDLGPPQGTRSQENRRDLMLPGCASVG
jgi:hypothetical protein